MEETLRSRIAEGRLIQVLRDWCPHFRDIFFTTPVVEINPLRSPP